MKKAAILFDMDGVILDSMPYHVKAWKEAFKEYGLSELEDRIFYLYEGAIEPEVACKLFSKNGTNLTVSDFFEILKRQKQILLDKYVHLIKPFDDVPNILEALKQKGIKSALVTSSHKEILEEILPSEIKNSFNYIVTGDQVQKRKPHPDPYLQGLKGLGLEPSKRHIAVENAPSGIKSAKSAGLSCLAITTTLSEKDLLDADKIVKSHIELMEMLG